MTESIPGIRTFHQNSFRHVLVLEADISYEDKVKIFHIAEQIRLAGNELTGIMKARYEQLMRTKKYRQLKKRYGKCTDRKEKKAIGKEMNEIREAYHVTWDYCRRSMILIGKRYNVDSIFALTEAENVWRGVEKCLFSDGKKLHFLNRDERPPSIRAKQINRGIILSKGEKGLSCRFRDIEIPLIGRDRFERDELTAIEGYLKDPEKADRKALDRFKKDGTVLSTYRPCYVTLVPEKIRGKLRVYVHIEVEGRSVRKYKKDGTPRHTYGYGNLGADIGTQTIAYTGRTEVGLKNLAERGPSILENERKERLLYRAMDRSRRAMNPEYYNEDGTIKKGKKRWKYSNRYRRLKEKHRELCRKNAINRHLAVNEDVNHLRSLGDRFITEQKNAKKLQKKAKYSEDENGKAKRRKRFGRSIRNRCPGYFQQKAKEVFESTGGSYTEVPSDYRASQYDHTCDEYRKKKLSERMYRLDDGTAVQRDWYSSYLLYQYDLVSQNIDKEKCKSEFRKFYEKEEVMIARIIAEKIKVLNSGIRIN